MYKKKTKTKVTNKYLKIVFIAIFTALTSLLPISLTVFFKNIEDSKDISLRLIIIVASILSANSVCLYLQKKWSINLTYEFSYNLRKRLFSCLANSKFLTFKEISTGKIANTYEYDLNTISNFYGDECTNSLPIILSSIIAIFVSISIMPIVSLISFSIIPIIFFIMQKIVKVMRANVSSMLNQTEVIHQKIFETMDSISEVYSFNLEKQKKEEFDECLNDIKKKRLKISFLENTCVLISSLGNSIPVFAVLVLGMYFVSKGIYSLSSWVIVYYLMEYSNSIFTYLPEFVSKYNEYKVSKSRYDELIQRLGFPFHNKQKIIMNKNLSSKKNYFSIILKDVSFEYPEKKILCDINLSINQGKKYFIQGPSGVGKTTLLDIISGVVDPTKGEVVPCGSSITYAYSSDRSGLFPGTIYDNFSNSITSNEVDKDLIIQKVIQILSLEDTLNEIPGGLFYQIKGGKSTLSGGQVQKITLARALCRAFSEKNSVLLLDEATSFIDQTSENKILKNILANCELTIVVVSHRDLPTRWFDKQLLLLESGLQTVS
ncbi:ABC transporter ATP-binding protein [Enterococcus hulanensis]|uniref:ABC transporter ATP-binding protein n=1 Tax=Enterococcus hulanensis TaxID=2559929 RepID=UPI00288CF89E|nr:ABC transporter ATP-binding protein [Enterococcus hulanensis]MDT2661131.1 ABC transporter ATP-binding protein [Enterococcus hulanensis]